MAPRRPCPSCATVFSRWNPKYLKGMCERRHLAGWVACLLGMYFNCVVQVFIQIRSEVFSEIPNRYNMTQQDRVHVNTLPDIGFDVLPHIPETMFADIAVFGPVAFTFFRFTCTKMGPTILRRWVFHLGFIFLMRGISISCTMLPNPWPGCVSTVDVKDPWTSAILIVAWQRVTCADVLFSGHTVNLTMCALIWDEYSHEKDALIIDTDTEWDLFETCCRNRPLVNRAGYLMRPTFMKVFMWVFCSVGFIVIIATKFHYTVDVFLGAVITIFVWKFYHLHIRTMWDAQRKSCNRVLVWAEGIAPDLVFFRERAARAMEAEEAEQLVPRVPRKRPHTPSTTSLISRGRGAREEETKEVETGSVSIVGVEMRESAEFAPSGAFNLV